MSRLDPEKLHLSYLDGASKDGPLNRRRYTLTHSDVTGDLFLAIGYDYDKKAIANWYTRLMRDEVLAEWMESADGRGESELHVYCHVNGGIIFGLPAWRDSILRYHMPLVLQAFRYGDRAFFQAYPNSDQASVIVHFRSPQQRYNLIERWGCLSDYNFP